MFDAVQDTDAPGTQCVQLKSAYFPNHAGGCMARRSSTAQVIAGDTLVMSAHRE